MPQQVRIIAGPRDETWDRFVRELVQQRGFGHEREYYGITHEQRANEVRRKLVTAGKHQKVSVRAYWQPCSGCDAGGQDCAYHVLYTAFHPDQARAFKARMAKRAAR